MSPKTCRKCGVEKPLALFYKSKTSVDGHTTACAECLKAKATKWRNDNPDKPKQAAKDYYRKNKEKCKKDALVRYYRNIEVRKEKSREWKEKNREKVKAYKHSWIKSNPEKNRAQEARRRARIANATVVGVNVASEDIKARWAVWGNKCYLCGKDAESTDHVKPLNKGGLHVPSNLRPICGSCNSSKKDKWPFDLSLSTGGAVGE